MTGRRPWTVGDSISLSVGYTFVPGVPIVVTAADAKVLCGRKDWDGRHFEHVGDGD